MASRLIIDGNSVYEIDEDCLRKKQSRMQEQQKNNRNPRFQRPVERMERKEKS